MKKFQPIYLYLIIVISAVIPFTASAQKLPTVQQGSLYAPAGIKVDGKATEWNNQFQAYNKATSIFYTVANDDDNLYLTIKAIDPAIIGKIITGGVTLSIISADKKSKIIPAMLTFPIMSADFSFTIAHKIKDPETNMAAELSAINSQLTIGSKDIKVAGISGIDSLISVYNNNGIKAVSLFNTEKAYTYELALPLKYLKPFISNAGLFKYNVTLNGMKTTTLTIEVNGKRVEPNLARMRTSTDFSQDLFYPTNFSGTYTLSK